MIQVNKAFAYIVRKGAERPQLLVMLSQEKTGYEVIRGKQEADETITQALIREIEEEAGIRQAQIVGEIGFTIWRNEAQYFFLLNVPDSVADYFVYTVTGSGEDRGRQFEYCWLDITPHLHEQLVEGGNAFVDELINTVDYPTR